MATVCEHFKFGYCKFSDSCRYKHVTLVCEDGQCEIKNCEKDIQKFANIIGTTEDENLQ